MEELKQWLESDEPDYFTGLNLFARHGRNRILLQNLNRRQHPGKLKYELQKIYDRMEADQKATQKPKPPKTMPAIIYLTQESKPEEVDPEKEVRLKIVVGEKQVNYEDLPASLKEVYDSTIENYKVMRGLHEKLKLMENGKPEDREPLVQQLISLDESIREGWTKIDAWDGQPDPVIPPADKKDSSEAKPIDAKRISANRKYISDNKKKLAGFIEAKDAKADGLRLKIQERVSELLQAKEGIDEKVMNELKALGIKID